MKTIIALGIMLSINMFLFLGDYAVKDISGGSSGLINYNNDFIGKFDKGNYTLDESANFPSDAGSISPETGNFFTDTYATMKNWLLDSTGIGWALAFINAVPNFLKRFLDPVFAYAIGFFWHALTIFLIVNFFRGSD